MSHSSKISCFGEEQMDAPFLEVADDLKALREKISRYLELETSTAQQIVDHIFSSQGKMVRPALFFLCCRLCSCERKHQFAIAAVCEYIHVASLLHDDVIDRSGLRRGQATAHSIWGSEAAVLTGDLIYATASQLMAQAGKIELVHNFARAIRMMSEGELLQLENLGNLSLSIDQYLRVLMGKTAVLMGASCKAAAILGENSQQEAQALEDFGCGLGMAFQIIDDTLDYCGSENLVGKNTFIDLKEKKTTLPIILLKSKANPEEWNHILSAVEEDKTTRSDFSFVLSIIKKYGCDLECMQLARRYTERAKKALLSTFPNNRHRELLEHLAERLLHRCQ